MGQLKSSSPFFKPGPPARIGETSPEIISFLAGKVEGEILDLGGGMGAYAQALRALGHKVTVGELDPVCLEELRRLGIPSLDMNKVAWEDLRSRFDTVMLIEVLEHVVDAGEFLKLAASCARRKLLLTVPCNDDFESLFRFSLTYNHIAVSDHLHQFTSGEIDSLMKQTGWDYRLKTGGYLFPSAALYMLVTSLKKHRLALLSLWPLRILEKLGTLPRLYPSRIFVDATRRP